jgi:hypothetical protein
MSPQKLNIPLPSKGLVVDRPAEYVDSRSAVNIKNMEISRSELRKRYGTSALGAALGERILRYFELQVGPVTRLIRVGPTEIEDYNQNTDSWASVTSNPLSGADTDVVDFAFPLLSGAKIGVYTNKIDPIRKISITGNDADLGGSPPLCKFVRAFGPYLVLAYVIDGGDTFYSRVQWCDTGDPETWTGGNANSVDLLEDPDDITGLGVFDNFLTVHKGKSIYLGQLVTTSDVFRFDRKATGAGAVSGATIANLPSGEQIFLSTDGIRLFNGITAPLIESPIQDELRESMNVEYLYRSQGVYVEELDEYHVAIPIGNDQNPNTVYKYNHRTKQIYKDYRTDLTALGLFTNASNLRWSDFPVAWSSTSLRWNARVLQSLSPVVLYGDTAGTTTRRISTTNNDNGSAVEGVWETKDFTAEDFGIPDIDTLMRWKGLELWAKGSGSLLVYYSLDGGSNWTLGGTLTLGADYPDDDAPMNVYFDQVKSRVRFRFYNATADETFTLKKYQIEATRREARK